MSPTVAEACRDSPAVLQWQMEHCCETIEGTSVPCVDVALENLRVIGTRVRQTLGIQSIDASPVS